MEDYEVVRKATNDDLKTLSVYPGARRRSSLRFGRVIIAADFDPDG